METSIQLDNILDFLHKDILEMDIISRNIGSLVIADIAVVLMVKALDCSISKLEEVCLDTHSNISDVFYKGC